jgi:hypothetical protein
MRVTSSFMTYAPAGASGRRGRLVLYASKLAAVAGLHPYVSRQELRAELSDTQAVSEADSRGAALATLETLAPAVRARVDAALHDGDTTAVARAADEARLALPAAAAAHVVSALYTANGTRSEARVIEGAGLRGASGRFLVSAEPWFSVDAVDVFLGGKHDATSADASTIAEVKTRQRRFLGAPLYERVQVHAYMCITGVRNATLVESFNGERREHAVPFDPELWERVRGEARAFVEELLASIGNLPTITTLR